MVCSAIDLNSTTWWMSFVVKVWLRSYDLCSQIIYQMEEFVEEREGTKHGRSMALFIALYNKNRIFNFIVFCVRQLKYDNKPIIPSFVQFYSIRWGTENIYRCFFLQISTPQISLTGTSHNHISNNNDVNLCSKIQSSDCRTLRSS